MNDALEKLGLYRKVQPAPERERANLMFSIQRRA
jgi:hypothetical protein